MRIADLARRPAAVTIFVDGAPLPAHPGELLAAALLTAGVYGLRHSPRSGQPRGAFCFMGVCQECLVRVNDKRVLACQTPVSPGMRVTTGLPPDREDGLLEHRA